MQNHLGKPWSSHRLVVPQLKETSLAIPSVQFCRCTFAVSTGGTTPVNTKTFGAIAGNSCKRWPLHKYIRLNTWPVPTTRHGNV